MEPLAIVELISAVYVGMSLIWQFVESEQTKSMRRIRLCSIVTLIWILSDASTNVIKSIDNNHLYMYIVGYLSYLLTGIALVTFLSYCETFIKEKTTLNRWVFRVPMILMSFNLIGVSFYYFTGRLMSFENGVFAITGQLPMVILSYYLISAMYAPAVSVILCTKKRIDIKSAILISSFCIPMIVAVIILQVFEKDYSVVLGAISIIFVSSMMQKSLTREWIKKEASHRALLENNTRVLALEDNFESLFDVNLETGAYEMFVKGENFGNIASMLDNTNSFFTDMRKNLSSVVYSNDRAQLMEMISPEFIKEKLKTKSHLDHYYRLLVNTTPIWVRMRVLYKDSDKGNVIIGIFNAEEEIAQKQKEEKLRNEIIEQMLMGNGVYVIDCDKDTRKTIYEVSHKQEEFTDAEPYSVTFTRYINKYVMESDREKMLVAALPENIQKKLENEKEYAVSFVDLSRGIQRFIEMRITRFSETEILQSFREIDREVVDNLMFSKLEEDYFALICADLDTGNMRILKNNFGMFPGQEGDIVRYTESFSSLKECVAGEAREFMERLSNIDCVKERFMDESKSTFAYKASDLGDIEWVNVTGLVLTRHEDRTPSLFVIGFAQLDETAKEAAELKNRLQDALEAADVANKSKTSFLFNMSHDIRTPMNAISGFTSMAIKYIDDRDKAIDYLYKTQQAGNMLLSLINSVLDVSRIESGKAVLDEQGGDVFLSFASIEDTMLELAKAKDVDLSFEIGNIRDRYVYCDYSRCTRILINVISNAIKYTNEGGYVRVRCEQLEDEEEGIGRYCYTIADNGIGMSEEFQKHVFEQFSRENTATVSGIQGTGLGMSVCKSFVDLMGGTISCKSKQGEGTVFTIILPLRIQDGMEYTDPVTGKVINGNGDEENAPKHNFTQRRILLVDDNELNREIATEMLREEGIIVEDTDDGTKAVGILKEKGPDYYDCILMDIQMPIMNGYEATELIRKMYPKDNIPIIALSANAFAEDKVASLAAGMNDHIAKPININELLVCMAKFVN